MQNADLTLAAFDRKLEETTNAVARLTTNEALLFQKIDHVMDRMDTFNQNITTLINGQSDQIKSQEVHIKGLMDSNQKLNYDNGRLYSNLLWMRAIFVLGLSIVLALLGQVEFQVNKIGDKLETYASTHMVLQQRIAELEMLEKLGRHEKI